MVHTVFVVEDSEVTRRLYQLALESAGYRVRAFPRAEPCLAAMETAEPSTVCLDLYLPGMQGMETLARIRHRRPDVPVVLITMEGDARIGVQAIKEGAADYLVKPVEVDQLTQAVGAAVLQYEVARNRERLQAEAARTRRPEEIVGRSPAMERVVSQIGLTFQNDVSVFLQGETGVGKDLIARSIHEHSHRASGRFVAVNCGALPRDLQESQFFGHERGSFTGAVQRHVGYFEEADGGTIFLDEVAELTQAAQVKLLRTLQDRNIRRVGGTELIPVDVRVISASNKDLKELAATGEFREDLYYRLVVFSVIIPPLRERREDIPLLVGHFLGQYCADMRQPVPEVSDQAIRRLIEYPWPGNVRELQNAVQVSIMASRGDTVLPEHLPPTLLRGATQAMFMGDGQYLNLLDPVSSRMKSMEDIELEVLLRAREMAGGNVGKAADMLRIGRATAYRRLQSLDRKSKKAQRPEKKPD